MAEMSQKERVRKHIRIAINYINEWADAEGAWRYAKDDPGPSIAHNVKLAKHELDKALGLVRSRYWLPDG